MNILCTGRLPKNEKYCSSLPQLSQYPLPPPLANWSCTDLVNQNLNQTISKLYPIDGNDSLGDCVIEGTQVQGSRISAGFKSRYRGPVISIMTASGKRLTVTPNHAVLTPRGFVRARLLNKGDNLVGTGRLDRSNGSRDFDFDQPPSAIEQIVASLGGSGTVSVATMPCSVDFHGDERFVDGNVQIVSTNSPLDRELNISLSEIHGEQQVVTTRMSERLLHRPGSRFKAQQICGTTSFSGVRRRRTRLPFLISKPPFSQYRSFGQCPYGDAFEVENPEKLPIGNSIFLREPSSRFSVPITGDGRFPRTSSRLMKKNGINPQLVSLATNGYATSAKPSANSCPTDTGLSSQLFERFSGLISIDEIVSVDSGFFNGHVYDLSTESRWYSANGIVAHNCTVAAAAHHITVQAGLMGRQVIPNSSDVVALYRQLGHGRDNGLELTQVLQPWMSGILGGNKILANCNVDPSNMNSVKQAIQYLGGVYIGFKTTGQSVSLFQNHQPWTDAGRQDGGGHCVVLTGFDDSTQMFDALTWGNIQKATYGWFQKYCDEVHAILTEDIAAFDSDTVANIQQAMPLLS